MRYDPAVKADPAKAVDTIDTQLARPLTECDSLVIVTPGPGGAAPSREG